MVQGSDPDDGFLSRWSRRKRAAESEAKAVTGAAPDNAVPAPLPAPDAQPAEPGEASDAAEPLPPQAVEAFIEPPSLDLIDQDFDLAHWLKQNVPESWKLAALRRTWETDPFIHGYLNPARDYALDWNTPGGAPGYGPLTESDDVKTMAARIFGDLPKSQQAETGMTDDTESGDIRLSDEEMPPDSALVALQHDLSPDAVMTPSATALPAQTALQPVRLSQKPGTVTQAVDVAMQHADMAEGPAPAASRQRRRSGGAIPM